MPAASGYASSCSIFRCSTSCACLAASTIASPSSSIISTSTSSIRVSSVVRATCRRVVLDTAPKSERSQERSIDTRMALHGHVRKQDQFLLFCYGLSISELVSQTKLQLSRRLRRTNRPERGIGHHRRRVVVVDPVERVE